MAVSGFKKVTSVGCFRSTHTVRETLTVSGQLVSVISSPQQQNLRSGVGVHTRHNDEGDGKARRAHGVLDVQLNTFSALELEIARGKFCLLCCMGVKLGLLHWGKNAG
jgi:hypothetical protein